MTRGVSSLPNSIVYLFRISLIRNKLISTEAELTPIIFTSYVHIELAVVCRCIRTSVFIVMTIAVFFAVIVVNN
jgi:hypothetical protein